MKKKHNTQVIREGNDITLVGWGAQLSIMEQACVEAEKVSDTVVTKLLSNTLRICIIDFPKLGTLSSDNFGFLNILQHGILRN